MLNDDLEIARKMLRGAWKPPRRRRPPQQAVLPAVFREIEGSELARQYATHRTIEAAARPRSDRSSDRYRMAEYPDEPGFGGRMLDWARGLKSRISD